MWLQEKKKKKQAFVASDSSGVVQIIERFLANRSNLMELLVD